MLEQKRNPRTGKLDTYDATLGQAGELAKRQAKRKLRKAFQALAKEGLKAVGKGLVSLAKFLFTPPVLYVTLIGIVILVGVQAAQADTISGDRGNGHGSGFLSKTTSEDSLTASGNAFTSQGTIQKDAVPLLFKENDCPEAEAPGTNSSGNLSGSDWTTVGTVAHSNAQKTFDFWVSQGLSGAAAAGIVGWVDSEGGFGMVGRAEGHFGPDPKKCSIMYGNVPNPGGPGYAVGGGGIYQFTPYTKYAPLNSPDWEDITKMSAFVFEAIKGGDWTPSHDAGGTNATFPIFAAETDPTKATLMWNCYERGNLDLVNIEGKKAKAQLAYDFFQGSKYAYDDAKFKAAFGASGSTSTPTEGSEDPCFHATAGGSWRGEGGQPVTNSGMWKPNDLPQDLREYALDPESVGLTYGGVTGWEVIAPHTIMHDQCTGLSAALGFALYEKGGSHPSNAMGNGRDVAKNWANKFGGGTTKEPSGGAIFSMDSVDGGPYGHTGVVSHVFDNGDILVVEQNWVLSGSWIGKSFTWNYRYVKKAELSRWNYEFYAPKDHGYKFVDGIKSK